MTAPRVRVWDRVVRLLHALLIASVGLAALTPFTAWPGFGAHRPAGYVAVAVVLLRLLWGVSWRGSSGRWGSHHARWSQCVRGPRATWRYLQLTRRRRAARHLGHNPLGAAMVLALLGCVGALGFSGWLYGSEAFWGDARVEAVHRALAWTLPGLVVLHIAGVLFTSRRHAENLIAAMVHGDKRAAAHGDIP